MLNKERALHASDQYWETTALRILEEYLSIANLSPAFDPSWRERGAMDQALALYHKSAENQRADMYLTSEIVRFGDRTPVLVVDVPGTTGGNVLMYGHIDKQPPFSGWHKGLEPFRATREGERLYGRGAADDGYALFAALGALHILAKQNAPRPRCLILIEACEESGSYDLPYYLSRLAPRISKPELVVCLDSGCASYDRLWLTTSLRGLVSGTLRADIMTEGVHSGDGGGIVPSTSWILRHVIARVEDTATGRIVLDDLYAPIPDERDRQARAAATVLGSEVHDRFSFVPGSGPICADAGELMLNQTWRPSLETIGGAGLPAISEAGNVLRPFTAEKLSLRIPPNIDPALAAAALKHALERDPPCGARVSFTIEKTSPGWNAPPLAPWLADSLNEGSQAFFGRPLMLMGEGGTIPFARLLGQEFPDAQFLVTGVLGPGSNAHGPNEFLHIPTAKRLTACLAQALTDCAAQYGRS